MPNDKPAASETADALAVYKELCQNIRATDDISFSILRAVPATAGVGSTVLTGIGAKEWLATYLFSPGIWWSGLRVNRSGSFVQVLQMNSKGVRPLSVLRRLAKL